WDEDHGMGWTLAMAPVPAAVLRALTNGKAEAETAALATRPAIPAGERHATLTRYAGRLLGKGHAPAEVHELLAALNVAKCQPSLPPTEVAQIVTELAAKDEAKLDRKSTRLNSSH